MSIIPYISVFEYIRFMDTLPANMFKSIDNSYTINTCDIPDKYKDFTIIIDTDVIKCNKLLLELQCEYFKLFKGNTMVVDSNNKPNIVPLLKWLGLPYYIKYREININNISDILAAMDYIMFDELIADMLSNASVRNEIIVNYDFCNNYISGKIIDYIRGHNIGINYTKSRYLFEKVQIHPSGDIILEWMINTDQYHEDMLNDINMCGIGSNTIVRFTMKFPQSFNIIRNKIINNTLY